MRLRVLQNRPPRWTEMLDTAHLRIDQKTDSRGKSRAFRRLGQSLYAERPADPDLPGDDALHRRLHAGELTGAAREYKPSPRMRTPQRESFSLPPRMSRMRLSTLSLRSG